MEQTEKQCSEALCALYNRIHGEAYSYEKEFDVLSDLIKEHYKNTSLRWEEINVGQPIYDKETKRWILVTDKMNISHQIFKWKRPCFQAYGAEYSYCHTFEFEENRFYRKEVVE